MNFVRIIITVIVSLALNLQASYGRSLNCVRIENILHCGRDDTHSLHIRNAIQDPEVETNRIGSFIPDDERIWILESKDAVPSQDQQSDTKLRNFGHRNKHRPLKKKKGKGKRKHKKHKKKHKGGKKGKGKHGGKIDDGADDGNEGDGDQRDQNRDQEQDENQQNEDDGHRGKHRGHRHRYQGDWWKAGKGGNGCNGTGGAGGDIVVDNMEKHNRGNRVSAGDGGSGCNGGTGGKGGDIKFGHLIAKETSDDIVMLSPYPNDYKWTKMYYYLEKYLKNTKTFMKHVKTIISQRNNRLRGGREREDKNVSDDKK